MPQRIPHPIPYQGSKRRLAKFILRSAPSAIQNFIEPFAGSAAVTLAAAAEDRATFHVIGDSLEGLALIWRRILSEPDRLAADYETIWNAQISDPRAHYAQVRDEFNVGQDAVGLLYLLARCVKNSVRFNRDGHFNQAADHRRRGMHPDKMRRQIRQAHDLLARRATSICADYSELLAEATDRDFVYLDPPYQGVSGRDRRYYQQLDLRRLLNALEQLNSRGVPYILSFDGTCGGKGYGQPLPVELRLRRTLINTGRSSQSTLAGRSEQTTESLYVSPALAY